jgi:8-oxo-dGTP pyrophosphatase MutT (NUDIX family)
MTAFLAEDDARLRASDRLADVVALLEGLPSDAAGPDGGDDQDATRATMLGFAAEHPDAVHRSCAEGHFTGSALVLDASGRRTALLFHRKLQRWLQPGGHADGDANLAAVALREAREETGLLGLRLDPVPVDLDIHRVAPPGDGPHLHLDVRFLVVAPPGAALQGNHESERLGWFSDAELADLGLDDGTHRLVRAARARFLSGD